MSLLDNIPFVNRDPYSDLGPALADIRDDHDALALLPYDDGSFWFKPADFDKELIGGKGGYETPDGDKIVLDGNGEAVRSLMGIDVVLACDPTEHAAAVEPIKAAIAHKHDIGEWIKVDRQGTIIEVGEALTAADPDIDIGPEHSAAVADLADDESLPLDAAVKRLEQEGEITKLYDLAPPAAPKIVNETTRTTTVATDGAGVDESANDSAGIYGWLFGDDAPNAPTVGDEEGADEPADPIPTETTERTEQRVELEEATHIAVDQSKAADLMPTTTSTTELNTALDKARMEEHEEGKLTSYFVYGLVAGGVFCGVVVIIMFLMMNLV